MYRQNRRIGGGGKSLVNLGKVSVLSLLAFSIFLSSDTFAGRRGSKTSGSSKRSASSQKNSNSSRSSKRSASPRNGRRAGGTSVSASNIDRNVSTETSTTLTTIDDLKDQLQNLKNTVYKNKSNIEKLETSVSGVKKYDDTDIRKLIKELSDKLSSLDSRVEKLEKAKSASTSSSSNSGSTSSPTTTELGYLKGSADLCKPDSSGHKYCSVAINTGKTSFKVRDNSGKGKDNRCLVYDFDNNYKWRFSKEFINIKEYNGKQYTVAEFNAGKPDLYVMTDFNYYGDTNSDNRQLMVKNKFIAFCGKGLRFDKNEYSSSPYDLGYYLFDDTIINGANKLTGANKSTIATPFTSSDNDIVFFDFQTGKAVLKLNLEKNLLEYKPNLSADYIKSLRYNDYKNLIDINGNIVK